MKRKPNLNQSDILSENRRDIELLHTGTEQDFVICLSGAPASWLFGHLDLITVENEVQRHTSHPHPLPVCSALLRGHHSARLFFSFYFQAQASTQRRSQSLTPTLPKHRGRSANGSSSICLETPRRHFPGAMTPYLPDGNRSHDDESDGCFLDVIWAPDGPSEDSCTVRKRA